MSMQDEQLDRALRELREQLGTAHDDAGAGQVGPVLAAARARLIAQVGAAPTRVAARRRRWPALAAAAAVVASLTAGGMLIGLPGTGPTAAEARAVLERAAVETVEATDPVLEPDQYRYVESRAWNLNGGTGRDGGFAAALVETRDRYWAPADPQDDWLTTRSWSGQRKWVVGSEADAESIGLPALGEAPEPEETTAPCGRFYPEFDLCRGPGAWYAPSPEFIAGLPRDPGELLDRLERDTSAGTGGDAELLADAADLLRSPAPVPADLRSALYLALSRVDGITLTPGSVNLDDRVGTAIGVDDGTYRTEIIVDPMTGEFIGERVVVTADGLEIPEGTVVSYSSVTTAVVDRIGEVPGG